MSRNPNSIYLTPNRLHQRLNHYLENHKLSDEVAAEFHRVFCLLYVGQAADTTVEDVAKLLNEWGCSVLFGIDNDEQISWKILLPVSHEEEIENCKTFKEAWGIPEIKVRNPRGKKSSYDTEIRRLLRSKQLTVLQVARSLGLDKSTISAWVTGRYTPNDDNLPKICNLLGISVKDGKTMFDREHAKYLEHNASGKPTKSTPKTSDVSLPDSPPTEVTSPEPEVAPEPKHTKVHVFKPSNGTNPKVVVKHTNVYKQLFGILFDDGMDFDVICKVLTAYRDSAENIEETLNLLYLKMTATQYRKLCKVLDEFNK